MGGVWANTQSVAFCYRCQSIWRLRLSLAAVAASDICCDVPSPGAFVLWCLIKVSPEPVGSEVKSMSSIGGKAVGTISSFFLRKMPSSSDKPAATATRANLCRSSFLFMVLPVFSPSVCLRGFRGQLAAVAPRLCRDNSICCCQKTVFASNLSRSNPRL